MLLGTPLTHDPAARINNLNHALPPHDGAGELNEAVLPFVVNWIRRPIFSLENSAASTIIAGVTSTDPFAVYPRPIGCRADPD
ncbi:hypothetical protein [Mesorhizobium sp. M0768]|uniref:hypothetical protein n=1 Tax=Mesorhizobium sp. M0768 TaxID=2956996 RepID=UPI003338C3D1